MRVKDRPGDPGSVVEIVDVRKRHELVEVLQPGQILDQYDDVIGIYDDATTIIRKLRNALETRQDSPKVDGEELSSREKEILVVPRDLVKRFVCSVLTELKR